MGSTVTRKNSLETELIMLDLHLIILVIGSFFSSIVESKTLLIKVDDNSLNQERITNPARSGYEEDYSKTLTKKEGTRKIRNGASIKQKTGSILILGGFTKEEGVSPTSVEILGVGICPQIALPFSTYGQVGGLTYDNVSLVCSGLDTASNRECITLNTKTMKWEKHSVDGKIERNGASIVFTPKGSYILGGNSERSKNTSAFLPLGSSSWTDSTVIPGKGVESSCVVNVNSSHVMVIGGGQDKRQVRLWDTPSDTWTEFPELGFDLVYGHACIMTEEGVMVTGGVVGSWPKSTISDQTLIINPQTGQVETVGPMLTKRWGHAMVRVRGAIILLGGFLNKEADEYITSTE